MRISVLVTTYNRPRALARVLHALQEQTQLPAEVVVADDGSGQDTAALIEQFRQRFPTPLIHAWQPDEGFRAGAVRNLAASKASGDWLHFLDGDCVPQMSFVERLVRLAEPGTMLAGDRIMLSESLTRQVENDASPIHRWTTTQWREAQRHGGINRMLPLRHWPFRLGRGLRSRDWRTFRTANAGISRQDFIAVNGFECDLKGWGFEDSEFAVRALRAGCRIRSARLSLGVFHLWHKPESRDAAQKNQALLEQAMRSTSVKARDGLAQTAV
ncbi:MAG: glycosyltransferase family 2 protein [Burkholderiaceae bacterium]